MVQRHNGGGFGDRNLVGAIAAMDEPGLVRPQRTQGFGHRTDQRRRKGPGQLPLDPSGVGQRAKDVENRARAQFGADPPDMAHRGVVHRRHHEADAMGGKAAFHHLGADHDVQAHFGQHIRRPGFRRQVAVAVLGDRHARARHDKGGGGRDVQRSLAVAAGADDVHRAGGGGHRVALGAHHGRGGGIFIDRLASAAQGHQKTTHLGRGCRALEQGGKGDDSLVAGQGARGGDADQGFEAVGHAGVATFAASRKLRSSWWPCSEAMLSG